MAYNICTNKKLVGACNDYTRIKLHKKCYHKCNSPKQRNAPANQKDFLGFYCFPSYNRHKCKLDAK